MYPRINKYVKVEHIIKDNYFTTIGAVYGVNMKLPENRTIFYLLACCLVGKYMSIRVNSQNFIALYKFSNSLLTANFTNYSHDEVDISRPLQYVRFEDSTGFYNADLGDAACDCVPFRELVDLKPNTTAKELRKALMKELNLKDAMWKDPYDVVYNNFKDNNGIVNYHNLPKFAEENKFLVALNDLSAVLGNNFSQLPTAIPDDYLDLALDFTMRHMARFKYGVKKNINEIRDYIGFVLECIQKLNLDKLNIVSNAIQMGLEGNEYVQENLELIAKLEGLTLNYNVLSQEHEQVKTESLYNKERLEEEKKLRLILNDKLDTKEEQLKQLQEEIKSLSLKNKSLEKELKATKAELNKLGTTEDNLLDIEEIKEQLKDYSIVLIGARPDFEAKVNEVLPFIKTLSMTQAKQTKATINNVDYCIMDVSYTSHPERYAVDELYKDKKFIYPKYKVNNLRLWLNDIYTKILDSDYGRNSEVKTF